MYVSTKPGIPIPTKAHPSDVGFDVAIWSDVIIDPGDVVRLPTGLHCTPPAGTYLRLVERSKWALRGLNVAGGVIDPEYTGDIMVITSNLSKRPLEIKAGEKIA
ncbi:dUTPase-like protein [Dimargaris cristalligena]|uniref:Deoxyuridine 5'-triphosphate nucleotidohydrolase n=1 Tax=Dimargaris cristalligena TaxID=215637 RepID=A0A4P9ZLR2_9FUNG|nr:dUTPase-like protein [Dimargaris cristalligena]|eukprot:RKP34075.1 dUTPase-like protein [Dimargaris cristalligena]